MCGRYQSWIEDAELAAIIERERRGNTERYLRRKEVFPGDDIPVLYGGHYFLRAKVVRWGYPMVEKRQERTVALTLAGALADPEERAETPLAQTKTTLVINARAETVLDKRFFRGNSSRGDVLERRVAIPTSGYYEWANDNGRRQKYHIGTTEPLYLAGITHGFGEDNEPDERAVILTTSPLPALRTIHDRMPLLLTKAELEPWLYDDRFSKEKLERGCEELSLMLTAV